MTALIHLQHLTVTTAKPVEASALSTVVPRAFHQSNEYFRTTLPDTLLLRRWWSDLFHDAIQDPAYHVLTILDDETSSDGCLAVGVLLLRRIHPDGSGENVFHRHPPTADHDQVRYAAMLGGSAGPRERYMAGRAHFSLDLFGVDHEYQGTGLGKKMLEKACAMADAEGIDIFVQANMYARMFYEKRGFRCVEEVVLPGPEKYGEVFLIYTASGLQATET